MKTNYSTAEGQKRLMRESVGQPTDFQRKPHSGFTEGQLLEHRDLNLRHPSTNARYVREGKPEGGHAVIAVKYPSGIISEWLARDWQPVIPS